MDGWLAKYQALILNPSWLDHYRSAASVTAFLQAIKSVWDAPELTDDELVGVLNYCNNQCLTVSAADLNACWLPYSYIAATREIRWCLADGPATEPFHDDYVGRCRQQLINQLIRPTTSLTHLLEEPATFVRVQPSGFIFHLSRCGSTLMSGALSELPEASVLSESSVLTNILLDASLPVNEKKHVLGALTYLQANVGGGAGATIIKWNAWDIFHWPLLRSLYPRVPVTLLIRNPLEILASHERIAGRHMSGDKSLRSTNPVLVDAFNERDIGGAHIEVLHALMQEMLAVADQSFTSVIDYQQLDCRKVINAATRFGVSATAEGNARIKHRMQFHSKDLSRHFQSDSVQKQNALNVQCRAKADYELMAIYEELKARAVSSLPENLCAV